ncbi:hypothetical protein AB6A40_011606 [Gnathostoma spinigerum]|uniref:Uncharacterized protein n=1 Tax=Gnathostoma spinigerum TaxID=75299 RepID=A0ABD6F094_9BILA
MAFTFDSLSKCRPLQPFITAIVLLCLVFTPSAWGDGVIWLIEISAFLLSTCYIVVELVDSKEQFFNMLDCGPSNLVVGSTSI